ncbi:MAG TPA: nuclear transport factor 2 family protein [Acidimicrobiales bacterium]|nr:nuclear transport factor 2 family protein [Acidimicrobiales bacterium]
MTPDAVNALADRFVAALEANDTETLEALYAPELTVWHNFDQVEQTREQNLATLAWVSRKMPDRRYDEIRRVVTPDGYIQQHVLRGTAPDGTKLEVPAILRIYLGGGRITRVEEYLDTAHTAPLTRR